MIMKACKFDVMLLFNIKVTLTDLDPRILVVYRKDYFKMRQRISQFLYWTVRI